MDNQFKLGCARQMAGSSGPDISGALLGQKPRYAPDQPFETLHIAIDLKLDLAKESAQASCRTVLRAFAPLSRVVLDAVEMKVLGAFDAEGRKLSHSHKDGKLTVRLRRSLAEGEEAEVTVKYRIDRPRVGLHFVKAGSKDALYPQVWSHSEPEDARYWFPCHDAPHTRLTNEVRITVPKGYTAVSNGVLQSKSESGGWASFHWRMNRPHAPYLISIAAGRFSEIEDRWEDIPVRYYCEQGREAEARRGFGKTPKMLQFFSEKIGVRYPYEHYSQVAVSEFPGGMEHTTCTTQTDAALVDAEAGLDTDFDSLVSHELAHQWFGDLLTCRDWSHAWLNESFATYFEVLFLEKDKGLDEALYELTSYGRFYFQEDESRYRRPIVTQRYKYPWVLFDRHLYEKGACFLHLVRHILGEEGWWKSIGHYVRTHQDKTVVTEDLIRSIREATGKNLQAQFDQWVYRAGYPSFQVRYRFEKGRAHVIVSQTQKSDEGSLFTPPVTFRFVGPGWERSFTETLSQKEHSFSWALPGEPASVEFDPESWILKKVDFKKPFKLWEGQLRRGKTAVSRIEAALALARWGDDKAVALIEAAFKREKFWGARAEFASAMGRIRSEKARKVLEGWTLFSHPKVRRAAVDALGGFIQKEDVRRFSDLARKDPSLHVRASAARALGQLRDASALAAVRRLFGAKSWRDVLRASAVDAFASSRLPEALAVLRKHAKAGHPFATRAAAIRSLGEYAQLDAGIVPSLETIAKDDRDERIQLAALRALGHAEDLRAEGTLKALRDKHPSQRVQVISTESLARIRKGLERRGGGS